MKKLFDKWPIATVIAFYGLLACILVAAIFFLSVELFRMGLWKP